MTPPPTKGRLSGRTKCSCEIEQDIKEEDIDLWTRPSRAGTDASVTRLASLGSSRARGIGAADRTRAGEQARASAGLEEQAQGGGAGA